METLTVEQFLQICESDGSLYLGAGVPAITYSKIDAQAIPLGPGHREGRTATLRISTVSVDRENHIVKPRGGNLDNFKLNPVFMWNHDGYKNPSNIIGKALKVFQHDTCIDALVEYAKFENNPLPDQLYELEKKGLLPGNSIGLRPTGAITRSETGVITIGEWELIDISKVSVPMNAKATNKLIVTS